ncbi:MAG: ABC transporter ATP-binding protein [Afipia sp.]|nr:ABC transporter ATP-binding protein [Afipia sp.]
MTYASSDHAEVPCLQLRALTKTFGGFRAISDVTLELRRGTINAIIGANGAGKSTLFNLITGHYTPTSGTVRYDDRNITGIAPHRLSKLGIGRSFQRTNVFAKLTVFENVQAALIAHRGLGPQLFSSSASKFVSETRDVLASVGLFDSADVPAGLLAYGDQKQLELGITLALDPTLLLLDEPTAGMSAAETEKSIELIRRIVRERGITLLFTEHDIHAVFSISDRILVLEQGSLIADGSSQEIRTDEKVKRSYLGGRE